MLEQLSLCSPCFHRQGLRDSCSMKNAACALHAKASHPKRQHMHHCRDEKCVFPFNSSYIKPEIIASVCPCDHTFEWSGMTPQWGVGRCILMSQCRNHVCQCNRLQPGSPRDTVEKQSRQLSISLLSFRFASLQWKQFQNSLLLSDNI